MRRRTTYLGAAVTILLVGGTFGVAPARDAQATPLASGLSDRGEPFRAGSVDEAVLDEISAHAIVEKYPGVTLDDARHQMSIQDDAARATRELSETIPRGAQAGFYIDRFQNGRLVVLVTDDRSVGSVEGFGLPILVRTVARSSEELDAIAAQILSQVGDVPELTAFVDVASNSVRVEPYTSAGAAAPAMVDRLVATYGDAVSVGATVSAPPVARACHPDHQFCSPPLRGGVSVIGSPMHPSGGTDVCTSAFFVRSNADNRSFMLTAGHCVYWLTARRAKQYPAGIFEIGDWYDVEYGPNVDAAIITIRNPPGWDAHPWVLVRDSVHTNGDGGYDIDGVGYTANIPIDYLLCHTGAVSGTSCGPLKAKSVPGRRITSGARVDISTCGGDSGGPFYKEHLGYGLLNSGQDTFAINANIGMGNTFSTACGAPSVYQGLGGALAAMNVHLP